ncbi:hypothetical protein Leryth_003406 [Lithospermum erythrorhizon]|nr:hypothetical protein Leryth_003406 [Lithospermum erythrorhizon]
MLSAPDLGSDDEHGVWKIDDVDQSFFTPPFRIRYARQDILLSMMVAFNLSLSAFEGLPTSAVILKFELLYAPTLEVSSGVLHVLEGCPAAVHEFRLSSRSLLGLHSYCPVYFDFYHSVLVDVTVHISIVKGGYTSQSEKASDSGPCEDVLFEDYEKSKKVMLFRAFVTARDILIGELHEISTAINQTFDSQDFTSKPMHTQSFASLSETTQGSPHAEDLGEALSKPLPITQKSNGSLDSQDVIIDTFSKDELLQKFHLIGNQTLYLWRTYLKLHRANRSKILEHLRNQWALDRKAEWSIWMVYSKVDMPQQYISSDVNSTVYHGLPGGAPVIKRSTEDPCQTAAMRAELHRRSIAQMKINNRFIQDLHIFGDPSRIPIVVVERAVNVPYRSASGILENMATAQKTCQTGRILKIVVFVHGFQGHHLDLRLVRNQWLLIDPKIEFLMSEANEEKTSGDFREMGHRLAQEVTSFIKKKMDKASRSSNLKSIKISFVGHSIGNIILRAALTESILEPYLRFLHTYVSISAPHLGYLYSSNSLFNSGLWLLKKLKGAQCIHQLTFTDDPDLRKTFLYNLCKEKTLENFKNIILISSPQDGYIPYHSARIETCQASSADHSKKGKLFLEMLNECLDQIRSPSSEHRVFMRCDVNFDTSLQGRNINTMIGRAAHIEFLESDVFARFIMWSFPELFR